MNVEVAFGGLEATINDIEGTCDDPSVVACYF